MTAMIIWLVFCIGLGMLVSACLDNLGAFERTAAGIATALIFWAGGIGVAHVFHWLFAPVIQ